MKPVPWRNQIIKLLSEPAFCSFLGSNGPFYVNILGRSSAVSAKITILLSATSIKPPVIAIFFLATYFVGNNANPQLGNEEVRGLAIPRDVPQ